MSCFVVPLAQAVAPWPGEAKLEDLPVEMAIDWIRYYEYPDE